MVNFGNRRVRVCVGCDVCMSCVLPVCGRGRNARRRCFLPVHWHASCRFVRVGWIGDRSVASHPTPTPMLAADYTTAEPPSWVVAQQCRCGVCSCLVVIDCSVFIFGGRGWMGCGGRKEFSRWRIARIVLIDRVVPTKNR